MLNFIDTPALYNESIDYTFDAFLVLISCLVAFLGAFAGLLMSRHVGISTDERHRRGFLIAGALTMGFSVWAMHFVGMLAVDIPINISYDPGLTVLSVLPAILTAALALQVISTDHVPRWRYIVAGSCIGFGIAAMHYTGMAAMRLDAVMLYDPGWFTVSVVVAVLLGIAALGSHYLEQRAAGRADAAWLHIISAALLALAISGMHYTGMAATYFFPGSEGTVAAGLNRFWLSMAVAAVSSLLALLAVAGVFVDRRIQSIVRSLDLFQHRLDDVIQNLNDGFLLFDGSGRLVMHNDIVENMYPDLRESLDPGTPFEDLIRRWAGLRRHLPEDLDVEGYTAWCREWFRQERESENNERETDEDELADGRWIYVRMRRLESGGAVCIWTDVTPMRKLQSLYEKLAHEDYLTGLPNRHLFEDRLEHAAAHARRRQCPLVLLYIDLDDFKPVNDTYGHEAGDTVLREVAARLQNQARDADTVARLGGDEFVVLLEDCSDRDTAERVAQRILDALSKPIDIGGTDCIIAASVGIGICPVRAGATPELDALLQIADEAMYTAKKESGSSIHVFYTDQQALSRS